MKPSNLFISTEGNLVLSDFGLSRIVRAKLRGSGGTHGYMAPVKKNLCCHSLIQEVLLNKECDVKADIWSAGVTIYKMKTKEELFLNYDEDEIIVLFEDSDKVMQVLEQRLQSLPEEERNFLTWVLRWDPKERPTADEVSAHEYFK